jgi:hypothetical protein
MVGLAVGLVAASALAQDPPVQEEQEEPPPPKPKLNEATFGLTGYNSDFALRQYASPVMGLALHNLRLFSPLTDGSQFAKFVAKGMPGQDNLQSVFWQADFGHTVVRADRHEFGYYVLDWRARPESSDKATSVTVDQALLPGVGGFASYKSERRDAHYPAPRVADLTKTQTVAAGVGGSVLGGSARLSATERRVATETGVQPTTLQRTYAASFDRDLSPTLSLGGTAAFSRIEQAGRPGSDVTSYGLNGYWEIGPDTMALLQFSTQDIDLNVVQNAYVRKRISTSARFVHRIPGWSLQAGYRHLESERVRTDQSFVDVPETDTFDFRAAGRLGAARVTLKGNWEDLNANAVMQTDDPRQLYWDNKAMLQARVETGNDVFAGYGTYTYRYRKNGEREVEVDWHNVALGGSYVFDWTLSGFAEVSFDEFKAQGLAETGQSLDFYFPDAWNFAVGVDWSKDPSLVASASLNFFESCDVRGAQLTLSARRALTPDSEIELIVAPWSRDDRLLDQTSFRTTFVSARYTVRF